MYIKVYIICEELENIIHSNLLGGICSFKLYVYNDEMNHFLPIIEIINLPLRVLLSSVIDSLTLSSTSIL